MSSIHFLWAAYASVWIIHGVYIAVLVRRYFRLKRQLGAATRV